MADELPHSSNEDNSSDGDESSDEGNWPYSRDELVAAISDFYTFITRLHIPSSALKYPPEGGWPNITPENCSGFGKSDFVVDLIKHLPYIDQGEKGADNYYSYNQAVDIHYKCNVIDYSHATAEDFGGEYIKSGEIAAEGEGPVTADTVALGNGHESGGRDILLDTKRGEVIEEQIAYQRNCEADVREYFADLKRQYEQLKLIPIPGYEIAENIAEVEGVPDLRRQDDDNRFFPSDVEVQYIRHIYRSHGWPTPEFRKEEALDAIRKFIRERDPPSDDEEDNDD
ncbi:hypothetical protein F5B20DRAFT_485852 [Whalleya microplaca]|nr:hypothetical protein F5B20DRAFT_485852 [Whalleya microplaca]